MFSTIKQQLSLAFSGKKIQKLSFKVWDCERTYCKFDATINPLVFCLSLLILSILRYLRKTERVYCFNQLQYASDQVADNPSESGSELILSLSFSFYVSRFTTLLAPLFLGP